MVALMFFWNEARARFYCRNMDKQGRARTDEREIIGHVAQIAPGVAGNSVIETSGGQMPRDPFEGSAARELQGQTIKDGLPGSPAATDVWLRAGLIMGCVFEAKAGGGGAVAQMDTKIGFKARKQGG